MGKEADYVIDTLTAPINMVGPVAEQTQEKVCCIGNSVEQLIDMVRLMGNKLLAMEGTIARLFCHPAASLRQPQAHHQPNTAANVTTNYPRRNTRQVPPPINNESRPGPRPRAPRATTYAGAATTGAETPFQQVTNSKNRKPSPLFNNSLSPIQREIVITTTESIPQGTMDDKILLCINKAIATQFQFMFAKGTSKNTVIL